MTAAHKRFFTYLTTSEEEKKWGLYVTGAGHIEVPKHVIYPFITDPEHHYFHYAMGRRLTDYQILYITKGKGIFESEVSGVRKVKAGDVFVLFPNVWHRFKPDEHTGWDEYWVECNGDVIKKMQLNQYLQPENPVLAIGIDNAIVGSYLKIINLVKEEKPGFQYILSGVVLQLLGQLIATVKYQPFIGKALEEKIQLAKLKMLESIGKPMSQEAIADAIGLGYSLYRKKFKEYTGISPDQYSIQLRIKEAKDLLITTDMSIKEIAYALSFNNVDYFFRLFKQKTGYTLSEYRKKNIR